MNRMYLALLVLFWATLVSSVAAEEIVTVPDPRMRSALTWTSKGWNEKSTLDFTNRLCETRGLSKEIRETLNLLIDTPDTPFRYHIHLDKYGTVPARTDVALIYLRLLRDEPDIKALWTEKSPDLVGFARRELLHPLSRKQARGWFATRLLQIYAAGGETSLRAMGSELKTRFFELQPESLVRRGARDVTLAAFQMLDEYAKGKVPNDIYDWLLHEEGVDWSI